MEPEMAPCARCKKMFPKAQLRRLWKFPLFILRLGHMTPGKEGEWLYCRSCARAQNFGVIFLVLLLCAAIVSPGHKLLIYGFVGFWIVGLFVWLILFIRYKIRMIIFKRRMASLSHEERECILSEIPEPQRQKMREYLYS